MKYNTYKSNIILISLIVLIFFLFFFLINFIHNNNIKNNIKIYNTNNQYNLKNIHFNKLYIYKILKNNNKKYDIKKKISLYIENILMKYGYTCKINILQYKKYYLNIYITQVKRIIISKIYILGCKNKYFIYNNISVKSNFFSYILKNNIFNYFNIKKDLKKIVRYYINNGYIDCKIQYKISKNNKLYNLYLYVNKGKIYKINNIQILFNNNFYYPNNKNKKYFLFIKKENHKILHKKLINYYVNNIILYYLNNGFFLIKKNISIKRNTNCTVNIIINITTGKIFYIKNIIFPKNFLLSHNINEILKTLINKKYSLKKINQLNNNIKSIKYIKYLKYYFYIKDNHLIIKYFIKYKKPFHMRCNFSFKQYKFLYNFFISEMNLLKLGEEFNLSFFKKYNYYKIDCLYNNYYKNIFSFSENIIFSKKKIFLEISIIFHKIIKNIKISYIFKKFNYLIDSTYINESEIKISKINNCYILFGLPFKRSIPFIKISYIKYYKYLFKNNIIIYDMIQLIYNTSCNQHFFPSFENISLGGSLSMRGFQENSIFIKFYNKLFILLNKLDIYYMLSNNYGVGVFFDFTDLCAINLKKILNVIKSCIGFEIITFNNFFGKLNIYFNIPINYNISDQIKLLQFSIN